MAMLMMTLQCVLLLAVLALLLRRTLAAAPADPRQLSIPDQLVRMDVRAETMDGHLRAELAQMRVDLSAAAHSGRDADAVSAAALREELMRSVTALGTALHGELHSFREDNLRSAEVLRTAVLRNLDALAQRLSGFIAENTRQQMEAQAALHGRLTELSSNNAQHQEKLRTTVSDALQKLSVENTAKLEEMRVTVDEKLHKTLHSRLTESFGQVTDQLNKVHSGLGEMSKLSAGVSDLSRIFTNVKTRGGFGETRLDMLLKNMLAASEYVHNASCRPGSREVVEFAIRFPGRSGERTLLPIDSKFPCEVWERLEAAYDAADGVRIASAGREFEASLRFEAKKICEKYINPPITTPHAIMFLPTEGLYAEVMRRDALQAEIQSKYQVTIAGPATLCAILTSFRMGFHMLALQEKGDEVWKVLESAKSEFGKFGGLMEKVERQVGTVQNTLREINSKTTTINRTLREVSQSGANTAPLFEESGGGTLRLVASGEE